VELWSWAHLDISSCRVSYSIIEDRKESETQNIRKGKEEIREENPSPSPKKRTPFWSQALCTYHVI
jgi:hypothetical protein